MALSSRWALDRAKENMERSYPVVGFLEDLTITLKVLERALPRFFSGVGKLYSEEMNSK